MTTAVTTQKDIRTLIQSDQYQKQFKMALPKHLTPERLTRIALTALTKTPKLMGCTQASLMSCILDCAQLGLEPDGRRAHLIPYGDKCTLIIDYKGLAELAMRSGLISHLHASLICDNDEYEENMGRVIKHKINRKEARGQPYAAYSHVVMKDGTESFEIMSKDEIESIKKRSRAADTGPWKTDPGEMWKKTVFRRHSKWLPLSPEFRDALDKDATMPIDVTGKVQISAPVVMDEPGEPKIDQGQPVEKTRGQKAAETRKRNAEAKAAAEAAKHAGAVGAAASTLQEPAQTAEAPAESESPAEPVEPGGKQGGPFAAPTAQDRGLDSPE